VTQAEGSSSSVGVRQVTHDVLLDFKKKRIFHSEEFHLLEANKEDRGREDIRRMLSRELVIFEVQKHFLLKERSGL